MPNAVHDLVVPDADRAELQRQVKDRAAPARADRGEMARPVHGIRDGRAGGRAARRRPGDRADR